ncbi:unnamed protein product [Durusdinium trenchii]|uniref:Uncharacterized protein n=1 Tax=Durusdinium trenchii TaxID=1381693 RepID=A0ABP0N3M9_9DINO
MAWASSRPCSTWSETDTPKSSEGDAFLKTLTETEFGFYGKYVSRFPGGIYSLNQNPDVTCIQSVGQVMPTLISSCSILFSALHQRLLTQRELLVAQGFPTQEEWTHGVQCSSFSRLSEWPSHSALGKMAGNSIHTNVSSVLILSFSSLNRPTCGKTFGQAL